MSHAARVLLAEDDAAIALLMRHLVTALGHRVHVASTGEEAWEAFRQAPFDLVVTDVRMPGIDGLELLRRLREFDAAVPVLVVSGYATVTTAVEAIRQGAWDYIEKPIEHTRFQAVVRRMIEHQRLRERARALDRDTDRFHELVGGSAPMRELFRRIARFARYPASVLVIGESGTGKELVARAIHAESPRAEGPFVAFNSASIGEALFESTLFGHKKGAFTGATADKAGLVQAAHGGTLFIDEVGEMPLANQAKLLRALETREVRMVGSTRTRRVDIRVVAATNADLQQGIADGAFREDLYWRLCGVLLELPPLRDRHGDLPLLAHHLLGLADTDLGTSHAGFAPDTLARLQAHAWPGNVRELRQVVRSMAMLADAGVIPVTALPAGFAGAPSGVTNRAPTPSLVPREVVPVPVRPRAAEPVAAPASLKLAEVERAHVARVLDHARGNKSETARLLGISRHALYRLLKRHDLAAA